MLSKEQEAPSLVVILVDTSTWPSKRPKTHREIKEINQELHFRKQEKALDNLTPQERAKYLTIVDKKAMNRQFNATLIEQIQQSPMKIWILEIWENQAFLGMRDTLT